MKRTQSTNRGGQEFYGGLIRLHILHYACKAPVFGLWFIEELGRQHVRDQEKSVKESLLDINKASADELKTLPGIGDAYSKR